MNRKQFENLKVGDLCVVRRGRDKDVLCEVRYIEDNSILIRPVKNVDFKAIGTNKKLRLTSWYELDIPEDKKTES